MVPTSSSPHHVGLAHQLVHALLALCGRQIQELMRLLRFSPK